MIAFAAALVLSQARSNWGQLIQTLTGRNGTHRFRVVIECANFQPRGRKIGVVRWHGSYYPGINGRKTWITDSFSRSETKSHVLEFLRTRAIEVRKFEVVVDGHRWRVPKTLTFDLLNLDLNTPSGANSHHGHAWLSKDGRRLVLKQDGSDGGGGYWVYFTFRAKGPVERRVYIESEPVQTRRA